MRLGSKIYGSLAGPTEWVAAVHRGGFRAAYCPLPVGSETETIRAYQKAAEQADIVIAEVGVWNNPLQLDPVARREAIDRCIACLELAEAIGARCCVNIAGSLASSKSGPHPDNLRRETFNLIVATVQEIIDAVQPRYSAYALETLPWIYPNSVESYVRLVDAINRDAFAVHFDPVNLVNSPERYFANDQLIRHFVGTLGPAIRSCHLKDVLLQDKLTVHLDEVRPGEGGLAIGVLLQELAALDPDLPVMLEHLPNEAEYVAAAAHVRAVAAEVGVPL
jgi:sugar phosphate isomerase/epimerase